MAKIIRIPSAFVYESKVVGVSHANADGTLRQDIIAQEVQEDDPLYLELDPENEFDENAIKVLSKNRRQIGFLKAELAEKVKPAIVNQTDISCKALWVNGEKMLGVGIRIELVS
ncbi:HIRAN domain-containing protein [Marinoscillum sp.]|uniref:HIRAN domain-containing protein n=1 Tax=Marinoscillum sp. TaxID=2024838 RepID=UPI003BA8CB05